MLTPDETRAHLARLTYREGWTWTLLEDEWEGPYVRFLIDVPDTHSDQTITLGVDTYLSPNDRANTQALDLWFQWRICRLESHEAREFTKLDGKVLFDPHAAEAA
jgi:hypothetical protein